MSQTYRSISWEKIKNKFVVSIKLALSILIIFIIIKKTDLNQLSALLTQVNLLWISVSIIFYILSKIISAFRFNMFLSTEGIQLSERDNLMLYWLGMYYNLLLPGGISGDGYKIKLLKDHFGISLRKLLKITFLDRTSGLFALGILFMILFPWVPQFRTWMVLSIILLIIMIAGGYYFFSFFGNAVCSLFLKTSFLSCLVQIQQIICIICIIFAFDQSEQWISYTLLFLISSVVAMIPVTIGGAGSREITFLLGADSLGIQSETAVGIAFVFYLISTLVAIFGIKFSFKKLLVKISD